MGAGQYAWNDQPGYRDGHGTALHAQLLGGEPHLGWRSAKYFDSGSNSFVVNWGGVAVVGSALTNAPFSANAAAG